MWKIRIQNDMNEQHRQPSEYKTNEKFLIYYLSSYRTPNCHRILMFAESPGGSRRTAEKKGGMEHLKSIIKTEEKSFVLFVDHRLSASKSFDDGLDDDNLDDSKIASALK